MALLYSFSILLMRIGFGIAAWFHPKARLFVSGRRHLFKNLQAAFKNNTAKVIWVHCASLGEFEQGRPVMERLRTEFPEIKILLTFFSPSGYEVRKNYTGADFVFYLPWDTASQAKRFVEITNPVLAIFIKYEFWYHFAAALRKKNLPLLSVSSIFRANQIFFQSYGAFFRRILKNFDHFFVQNQTSLTLLKSINIPNATVAGDTRFDRVHAITQQPVALEAIENFKGSDRTFVVGSMWPEDLDVLAPFMNDHKKSLRFIIAPHEISETFLQQIETSVQSRCVRYSQIANPALPLADYSVLIIDNVGMLSKLYRYGEFAYVGGAYGKGLHNILEAACYGVPIFFGNLNYEKFKEATDLIMRGGAFALSGYAELEATYELMVNRPENFMLACEVTKAYVEENLGATEKIISHCRKLVST
ncbi:MAG: 3-deoxy-D-manno-octulosonic acid transferase [Cyclobacteriaceae bacterium]|nr:3-deoxy-D-manno-octulosonic acid transferase [Cyclobacteriaceae bacterium]